MKLLLFAALLLVGASANQEAAARGVAGASGSDQSTDASRAVTYVQSHVTAHDDGYGHGPDEVHRHTVATTYHYPDYQDYRYPAQHSVYVAPPVYGHPVGYAPGYGGYAPSYGHDGYGPVGYGHGPVGYGHGGHPY